MKGVPDLLYKRGAHSRQIPPMEMWLAKCQVLERAISLSQNPTCRSAGEPEYG
jgi:hypothetical protein